MEQVYFNKDRVTKPIKMWLPESELESGALDQAVNLANLPFTYKWVSVMPDAHQGYGMPIGGVLATKGVVIPNAVGVDIGCGMCAMRTDIIADDLDAQDLKKLLNLLSKLIPVGPEHHKQNQDDKWMPEPYAKGVTDQEYQRARKQVGTLGGGNHFVEIQKSALGYLWVMIHSGSRNFGYRTAKHYNELAQALNSKWYSSIPTSVDMAFFPIRTQEFIDYIAEQNVCVEFALNNRLLMMERVKDALFDTVGSFDTDDVINKPHNFVAWENHFKENVLVHRKGSCRARKGEYGMIPGSQGTNSYIVKGLGNADSFDSCSHGAGRTMSRSKARKVLDLATEKANLDKLGVIHMMNGQYDLDEAPSAYKDIDIVMNYQTDLVEIVTKLTPLAVLKAHGGKSY